MKITKKLKYATFVYDEETKEFTIKTTPHGETEGGYASGANSVKLNKIYSFAFMRFVIRMAQRNWLRASPKKEKAVAVELAEHPFEDPSQTEFSFDEIMKNHWDELPF